MTRKEPERIEVNPERLRGLVDRAAQGPLNDDDLGLLGAVVETLIWLTAQLDRVKVSLKRIRKVIFGSKSEKTKDVTPGGDQDGDGEKDSGGDGEKSGKGTVRRRSARDTAATRLRPTRAQRKSRSPTSHCRRATPARSARRARCTNYGTRRWWYG